jgi:hypothetical protein
MKKAHKNNLLIKTYMYIRQSVAMKTWMQWLGNYIVQIDSIPSTPLSLMLINILLGKLQQQQPKLPMIFECNACMFE